MHQTMKHKTQQTIRVAGPQNAGRQFEYKLPQVRETLRSTEPTNGYRITMEIKACTLPAPKRHILRIHKLQQHFYVPV